MARTDIPPGKATSPRARTSMRQTSYLRPFRLLFRRRGRRIAVVGRIAKGTWGDDGLGTSARMRAWVDFFFEAIDSRLTWRRSDCWWFDARANRSRCTHGDARHCGSSRCGNVVVASEASQSDERDDEESSRRDWPQTTSHARTLARHWLVALARVRFRACGKQRNERPVERAMFTCAGRRTCSGACHTSAQGPRASRVGQGSR